MQLGVLGQDGVGFRIQLRQEQAGDGSHPGQRSTLGDPGFQACLVGVEALGVPVDGVEFRTVSDQQAVLEADVQKICSSPYPPQGLAVVGARYDVRTGRISVLVPAER